MKSLLAFTLLVCAALPALALDEAAERERIGRERTALEAKLKQQQIACRARFAVSACERKARTEYNAAAAELRRQEQVLNDLDRRQRAAQRQQELDERNSPEERQKAEERREKAVQDQKDREAAYQEKTRKRAEDEAERAKRGPRPPKVAPGAPAPPQGSRRAAVVPKPNGPTPEQAAENRAAYERRMKEVQEHNAEVQKRIAERKKPAASDLPVPP